MGKYCKTAKGHQEISDRAAGLGARARRLLILIDGQRDSEELARLAGDAQVEDYCGHWLRLASSKRMQHPLPPRWRPPRTPARSLLRPAGGRPASRSRRTS